MDHPNTPFAETRRGLAATAPLVVLLWIIAAALVVAGQTLLEGSPAGAAAATIGTIVLAAWAYTRFCARECGISHALGVGITWLALAIGSELLMTTHLHHGWYRVLGSPAHPLLRNVLFFVWIFSPALFARRDEN